jgi:hypothetical protein
VEPFPSWDQDKSFLSVVYGAGGVPVLKGFGRFVNLSEVALLFYRDDNVDTLAGDDPVPPETQAPGSAGKDWLGIRCVMLPEMWTVSPGYSALFGRLRLSREGNDSVTG